MPATENRDLASNDLWQDSLERSVRRREQAAHARKEQNRRKTASLAVSAAVVAAPMWPSVAASGRLLSNADAAEGIKPPKRERVLLSFGDRSPSVASVQHKLRIVEDGIFGAQTEAAVRAFQKRSRLSVTGDVDIRTWLALFPNDAVVATPGTDSSGEPQWAALSTKPAEAAPAATVPASVSVATDSGPPHASEGSTARRGGEAPKAKAAAKPANLPPDSVDSPTDPPTSGGVTPQAPPADGPADSTPAPVGGKAPSGGPGAPAPPRPLAPIAPGGTFNEMIKAMIREANRIDRARYSYRWGGGHNSRFAGPYDCSGAVSAVLHAAGLLKSPMVSGAFTRWGARGKGVVTIYANSSHVYMSIRGRFFGTSGANPGGGAGWFRGAPRRGFVVVHVPFERMKPGKRARTRAHAVKPRKRTRVRVEASPKPRVVAQGDSVTGGAIAGTQRPAASSPAPAAAAQPPVTQAPPAAPAAGQAPAGSTGQVPSTPAQPAPVGGSTPAGSVSAPSAPSNPTGPQGPPPGAAGPPAGTQSAPSGPAPAPGPAGGAAPGAQAPSASPPVPGPSGTPGEPGSSGPAPGTSPPPPAAPAQSGPVSELGKKVMSGAGDAVDGVTSKLAPEPVAPSQSEGGP